MTNERVRLPRKLSKSVSGRVLAEVGRLHPVGALGITLNMLPLNRVTMTLAEDDLPLLMHDLVEVYNQNGSVGVYRVTKITNTHRKNRRVELSHGLDVFSDASFTMSEDFTGTVATFLQKVINSQTQTVGGTKYWRLGTCADTNTWNKDIKFDNLMECLMEIAKTEEDYMFTFDQSTFPWTLNFVAKDSAVLSEFRLSRNVENCQVTLDDSDMCNRLLLSVDTTTTSAEGDTTTTTHETHNDTASQAKWGVIIKTAGIKAEDVPDKAAWVSQYFARHGQPGVQISIDGWELNRLTGETLDEVHLARICRVALPDYDTVFNERVVSVSYPDALRNPKHVNVSLANKRQKAEGAFSDISSQASRAASAARDNSKKIQNNQTSNAKEYNTIVARVETTEGDIRTIEGTGVFQNSERITQVAGKFTVDRQGNVHVINGSNLYLDDNTGSFAVYTDGNLTAGVLIDKIVNDHTQAYQTTFGTYINNQLDAGVMVQKITGDSSGNSIGVKLGTFVDNYLDAGVVVSKVTGSTEVSMGTYINNQLDAGVMVRKLSDGNTITKIKSDYIDFEGKVTASYITSRLANATIANVKSIYATTLTAGTNFYMGNSVVTSHGVSFGGGSIKFSYLTTATADATVVASDLPHYHTVSFSNGQFTLGGVTDTAPGPFDITATTWYKNQIAAAKNSVYVIKGWEDNVCSCIPSEGTGAGAYITLSQTTENPVSATPNLYRVTVKDGNTTVLYFTVDASGRYNAGETAGYTDGYSDGVNDGYLTGWNAAVAKISRSGNSIIGPATSDGSSYTTETKYTANYTPSAYTPETHKYTPSTYVAETHSYTASSYTAEETGTGTYTALISSSSYKKSSHSHTPASMLVNGVTYTSSARPYLTNYTGVAAFGAGSDSYTPSSYTEETTGTGSYTYLSKASSYTPSSHSYVASVYDAETHSYTKSSYTASSFSWS